MKPGDFGWREVRFLAILSLVAVAIAWVGAWAYQTMVGLLGLVAFLFTLPFYV